MVQTVPQRKRPVGKTNPRVVVEVYPQDADLVHRMRRAAFEARVPLREWLLEAGRQRLERDA